MDEKSKRCIVSYFFIYLDMIRYVLLAFYLGSLSKGVGE